MTEPTPRVPVSVADIKARLERIGEHARNIEAGHDARAAAEAGRKPELDTPEPSRGE